MGLYQLIYCDYIPQHASVFEAVSIAKKMYGEKVAKFINAILRKYIRQDKIEYPKDVIDRLSTQYSFPKEIIETLNKFQ